MGQAPLIVLTCPGLPTRTESLQSFIFKHGILGVPNSQEILAGWEGWRLSAEGVPAQISPEDLRKAFARCCFPKLRCSWGICAALG